jgi:hypothetical protein
MKTDRLPGDQGFDPLGLRPEELKELQTKERNNGRLATEAIMWPLCQHAYGRLAAENRCQDRSFQLLGMLFLFP